MAYSTVSLNLARGVATLALGLVQDWLEGSGGVGGVTQGLGLGLGLGGSAASASTPAASGPLASRLRVNLLRLWDLLSSGTGMMVLTALCLGYGWVKVGRSEY